MKIIAIILACIVIAALAFVAFLYLTFCTGSGHGIC